MHKKIKCKKNSKKDLDIKEKYLPLHPERETYIRKTIVIEKRSLKPKIITGMT